MDAGASHPVKALEVGLLKWPSMFGRPANAVMSMRYG
jgi:hypothetical protein